MQRFFALALALCLGLTLGLDAHAKRLGAGKSFGSAPSHQSSPMQKQSAASLAGNSAAAAAAKPAASGMSRWLGPLAGIAAGGLLASLLFGEGFQGLQLMDMLIFAGLAFVLFKLIASRRVAHQPAVAGGAPLPRSMPSAAPLAGSARSLPAWFDQERFMAQGREHFLALQQHWDANEMDKIAEFFTPQMTEFLRSERANLGDGYQSTYIDNLEVEFNGLDEQADKAVATLTFNGVAKSSRFDQGEAFSESWRLERVHGENQPWLVAGIRQNG